jgi:modulator of FtsH protease
MNISNTISATAQTKNLVLSNTYKLLSGTLIFSAVTAYLSLAFNAPSFGLWILLPYIALLYGIEKTKHSTTGIYLTFALTGLLGFTLGPMLNMVLSINGGSGIVINALGGTGFIFLMASQIGMRSKRDFSSLKNFMMVGILVAFVASILNYLFFSSPVGALVISAIFIVVSSGFIMTTTNDIINGGETNYITATVTLYVMLYNIFVSLLHILTAFSGDD